MNVTVLSTLWKRASRQPVTNRLTAKFSVWHPRASLPIRARAAPRGSGAERALTDFKAPALPGLESSFKARVRSGAATTTIEWTDHTWNPFAGCSRVSEGCVNCYAERLANRLEAMGQKTYEGTTTARGKWSGRVNRASAATFRKPLTLKKPSLIFVNSMSDFWHPNALDAWRAEAFEVMAATPQHAYQILTKRPELVLPTLARMGISRVPDNVWLGATVEDGRVADRIPHVQRYPAATTFLSIEPMVAQFGQHDLSGIGWVITGGESGPGARPSLPDWTREVRDLCVPAGIPFFHKQWGAYRNNPLCHEQGMTSAAAAQLDPHGKGGALLDGILWRDMPAAPAVAL
ncbi:MAG: phage Gp37/Gp68 family protein [Janthinobacterium lividum]